MNNEISRTAVRAYERAIELRGDVNFVLVSIDADDNPGDVKVYTSKLDAFADAATVESWVIFIVEDGDPRIFKTDGYPSTFDLASRNDANDDRPLGIGVEVVFRADYDALEVGTIADVREATANGPQAETVFRVNDGAGKSVGWFTAVELKRHNRPTWTDREATEAEQKATEAGLSMLDDALRGSRTPLRIDVDDEREEANEAEDARLVALADAGIATLAEQKAIDAGLSTLADSLADIVNPDTLRDNRLRREELRDEIVDYREREDLNGPPKSSHVRHLRDGDVVEIMGEDGSGNEKMMILDCLGKVAMFGPLRRLAQIIGKNERGTLLAIEQGIVDELPDGAKVRVCTFVDGSAKGEPSARRVLLREGIVTRINGGDVDDISFSDDEVDVQVAAFDALERGDEIFVRFTDRGIQKARVFRIGEGRDGSRRVYVKKFRVSTNDWSGDLRIGPGDLINPDDPRIPAKLEEIKRLTSAR